MSKIKFTVSARTARLIGRENVSNPSGALIELIKNCHDADSLDTVLIFDIKYHSIPEILSNEDYEFISSEFENFESHYLELPDGTYKIKKKELLNDEFLGEVFRSYNSILLCDNGHGMTAEIIEDHWMTIGTDFKLENPHSPTGRVKSGAKGIGRFALDRLGRECELFTYSKENSKTGLKWTVDWDDFEKPNKRIDEISADLDEIKNSRFIEILDREILKKFEIRHFKKENFQKGTLIIIKGLRDWWRIEEVKKAYASLESLVPPTFQRKFKVIFHDERDVESFGIIKNSDYNDFDYKLEASITKNMDVKIKLYRNEFDHLKFPKDFFSSKSLASGKFKKKDFDQGYIEYDFTISELLASSNINKAIFEKVGAFDMSFLFMKKGYNKDDSKKFFYRNFEFSQRKERLALYSGIKIYRDNFKVRPYGEIGGNSFDWLGLGERVTISPAGPTHLQGRWRVRSTQVIGSLNISRIKNEMFEDKSSREGIQENDTFSAFKNLVIAIIDVFEEDRQMIMRALNSLYVESDIAEIKITEADKIVTLFEKIPNDKKAKDKNQQVIIEAYKAQKDQIKGLVDENKLLVGLASTGLTISAFSHELKNIKGNLVLKTNNLEKYIIESIDQKKVKNIAEYKDPRVLVKDLHSMNKRINNWLTFTLECVKQDKRTRKKINFDTYFKSLSSMWDESLKRMKIDLSFKNLSVENVYKKMFQLDLDSVFNNLIVNSVSAFEDRKDGRSDRKIEIIYEITNDNKIRIRYSDSGPGIDPAIKDKDKIFEPLFTTKKSDTGEVIGTGMGMWIIQKSIREYKGTLEILDSKKGFLLEIKLPLDSKEK